MLYVNFVAEVYLIGLVANESKEVSLNGSMYDFSVDYHSIDKSDILNIHKYLTRKHNLNNLQPY